MPAIVARARVLTHPVRAWEDYINWATEKADGSWLFRGHGNDAWELIASIGRPEICGPKGWVAADETALFEDFVRLGHRFYPGSISELGELAIAQHYGIPTRLLDWTTDPLVAIWFALNAQVANKIALVHAIRVPKGQRLGAAAVTRRARWHRLWY